MVLSSSSVEPGEHLVPPEHLSRFLQQLGRGRARRSDGDRAPGEQRAEFVAERGSPRAKEELRDARRWRGFGDGEREQRGRAGSLCSSKHGSAGHMRGPQRPGGRHDRQGGRKP